MYISRRPSLPTVPCLAGFCLVLFCVLASVCRAWKLKKPWKPWEPIIRGKGIDRQEEHATPADNKLMGNSYGYSHPTLYCWYFAIGFRGSCMPSPLWLNYALANISLEISFFTKMVENEIIHDSQQWAANHIQFIILGTHGVWYSIYTYTWCVVDWCNGLTYFIHGLTVANNVVSHTNY